MPRNRTTFFVAAVALFCGSAAAVRAQPNQAASSGPAAADAGPTSPAAGSGSFGEIDGLLYRLSAASSDMRKFIDGGVPPQNFDAQRCRAGFAPKDLLSIAVPDAMLSGLVDYHECRAYVETNPDSCDALDRYEFQIPEGEDLAKKCRVVAGIRRMAQIMISRAPDALERCSKFASEQHEGYEEDQRKMCAFLVNDAARSPDAPAKAVALLPITRAHAAEVAKTVGMLIGDERTCEGIRRKKRGGQDIEECLGYAAYRKAFAAKDAELCGRSAVCRLMMGASGDCGALVSGSYCAAVQEKSRAEALREHERTFHVKMTESNALLALLSPKIEAFVPKDSPEFESRKEHFVALRGALERAEHEFKPAGAP
jgi:hypothetical protein